MVEKSEAGEAYLTPTEDRPSGELADRIERFDLNRLRDLEL